VGAGLVLPYAHAAATGLHLAEISHRVAPGAHGVVVLDRAGWHGAGEGPRRPRQPHPPAAALPLARAAEERRSSAVENVWQYLRQNHLSLRGWPDYDAILATCCRAWNARVAMPDRLASITRREWAKAASN
jgi:hypothetical protein